MAGCLNTLHLSEDNARILLLILVLGMYMLLGALFFQYLEAPLEQEIVEKYWKFYNRFRENFVNESIPHDLEEFHNVLYAYGNATAIGIIHKKPRWDFSGSFHFVTTIVSTIGKVWDFIFHRFTNQGDRASPFRKIVAILLLNHQIAGSTPAQ